MQNKSHPVPTAFDGLFPPDRLARWPKLTLVGAVTLLALSGVHLNVQAVALGAVTVQSALGEPLRARVEVPQITSEEASTLEVRLASPDAFANAGVAFSPALAGAQITLLRLSSNSAYLNIVGTQPVNEPVLGLVIEADWASGRIVRDYMMLLDPPGHGATRTVETTAPAVPTTSAPRSPAPTTISSTPRPPVAVQTTPQREPAADTGTTIPSSPARQLQPRADSSGRLTVQHGDTASELAVAHGLTGVSLDQMLLAMLRANPNAFIQDNVNLIKAGAVISMPSAEQAREVSRTEARRIVHAQTEDFIAYRRGLAQNVQATRSAPSERAVEGEVETRVDDRQAAEVSEDRLEISRGAEVDAEGSTELARSRQEQEEIERVAELDRNISELAELVSATEGAETIDASAADTATDVDASGAADAEQADTAGKDEPADASVDAAGDTTEAVGEDTAEADAEAATEDDAAAATTEAADVEAGENLEAIDVAADEAEATETKAADAADQSASESTPAPQTTTVDTESNQSPAPAVQVSAPIPTPAQPEVSLIDRLMEYRWLIVGVLALLALLGLYRSRRRDDPEDDLEQIFADSGPGSTTSSIPFESRLSETATTARLTTRFPESSEAALREATTQLEHGNEDAAEELLTSVLVDDPENISVHQKLAQLYASRGDTHALAEIATKARELSNSRGMEWQAIAALGSRIDPDNALYRATGSSSISFFEEADDLDTFWSDTKTEMTGSGSAAAMDDDPASMAGSGLDLDLDLGDDLAFADSGIPAEESISGAHASTMKTASNEVTTARTEDVSQHSDLHPVNDGLTAEEDLEQDSRIKSQTQFMSSNGDLDLDIDFAPPSDVQSFGTTEEPETVAKDSHPASMIELDFGDLALDDSLAEPTTSPPKEAETDPSEGDDPMATKLTLAQEFQSIGDLDGARSLATEVAQEASGKLKVAAEQFLQALRKQ